MSNELKVGDLVWYSDTSIEQCEAYRAANENYFCGMITKIANGRYAVDGSYWDYAIKADKDILTIIEVVEWYNEYKSLKGLQYYSETDDKWFDANISTLCLRVKYRVAPKNIPDDPTTWVEGTKFFRKEYVYSSCWVLDEFREYSKGSNFPFLTASGLRCTLGKLATPKLIKAWDELNND